MKLLTIYKEILRAITSKERRRLLGLTLLNILMSLIDITSIVFVLIAIGYYTDPIRLIKNYPLLAPVLGRSHPLLPAFTLILLFGSKHIAGHLVFRRQCYFIMGVATRISRQNLANYLSGSFSAFTSKDSAKHVRNILHVPTEFAEYVLFNSQLILTETALVTASITLLLLFKTQLFLILLLTLAPVLFLLFSLTRKRLGVIKRNLKEVTERSLQFLHEALGGFVESNVYGKNNYFIERHHQGQQQVNGYVTQMQLMQDLPPRYFEVFAILGLAALMLLDTHAGMQGDYAVMINAFMAAAYKIIPGVARIVNRNNQLQTYLFTLDEVYGATTPIASVGSAVTEEQSATSSTSTAQLTHIDSLQIRDLSFRYKGSRIFHEFCADFKKGTLSIVYGQSGKGKSTLFNLLLNLCSPGSGKILYNGVSTTDIKTAQLWKHISYMKQTPFLVHASLLDNIVLFDKNYDAERLKYSLEVSGLEELFEEGSEKMIMEQGRNISGGQGQRIMLARAIYKDFDLLLLDEPFSELDGESVEKIMSYLQAMAQFGKIIILISHNRQLSHYGHQVIDLDNRQVASGLTFK